MNTFLKQGDLVKYHNETPELNSLGFVLGRVYEVKKDGLGLYVRSSQDLKGIGLVKLDNELTDYADHFSKHNCPVVLPRGLYA